MARIYTDQPATGKPVLVFVPSGTNSGLVPSGWTTLVEAPDFSVPLTTDEAFATLDPTDSDRELRPGEVFFETPLTVTNTTATTRWIEARMVMEGVSGQTVPVSARVPVPASETVYVPIQGLRLLKTNFASGVFGGRLQVQAEVGTALAVLGTAVELEAVAHAPNTEA
jgi:hypothetical protein